MRRIFIKTILSCAVAVFGANAKAIAQNAQTPSSSSQNAAAKTAAVTPNGVIGTVTAIDANTKQITVKADSGEIVVASLDDKTVFLRVPPGETKLDKATKIALTDIGIGDRVFARGKVSDDKKSVPARAVIVMTKADIAKKQEHDREEWRRRGIVGTIAAVNPDTKEITLQTRGGRGMMSGAAAQGSAPTIVVEAKDNAVFRRYAPDSVKFEDAKPSSFAELKVGDQLRALGEKSADGARFTAEEIVSGTFRTFFATVDSINPQTNEITLTDLQSGQKLTVVISPDSNLRRLPPEAAARMAGFMQPRPGGAPNGENAGEQNRPPRQPQGEAAQGGEGGMRQRPQGMGGGMGGRRGGGFDPQDFLQMMPQTTIAELKKGDAVIVSSTVGNDPKRVTAVALLAGVDAFANMMRAGRNRVNNNMGGLTDMGLPAGLDIGIGLP
jgi:preprotein translocase subunit YajC